MDIDWNMELGEYIKSREPDKKEKAKIWKTAIGLQEVDGLKPSEYLVKTAKDHIEGKIKIDEVEKRIKSYYKESGKRKEKEENSFEADMVSKRITEILSDNSFSFTPIELKSIHKRLFTGVFDHAGEIRSFNIEKEEWVLNGETVNYANYDSIMETLKYDFEIEKEFSYKDVSLDDAIKHIAKFISSVWQVHPFAEGNTRTTAVFLIKYLRTFGFEINDEPFAKNSWYFRNSLVRANYANYSKRIFEDYSFLEKFLYNLLSSSNYQLKNRYTHVDFDKTETTDLRKTKISLDEQTIINLVKRNPNITQEDIAENLNKSLRTVKTRMKDMQEKEMIKRENGKKDSLWTVIKEN